MSAEFTISARARRILSEAANGRGLKRTSGARPREMRQSAFAAFWQDRLAARTIAVILGTRAERPCRDAQVLPNLN